MPNCPRTDKLSLAHKMSMALDIRLACLRDAILEDWIDLEAYEDGGMLVIRLRDGVKSIEKRETEQPEKPDRQSCLRAPK